MQFFSRFAKVLALSAVALFVGLCGSVFPTSAHDRGDFLPGPPTPVMKRVMYRGYGVYTLDVTARQWPGVYDAVKRCYADHARKTGIYWLEAWVDVAEAPDVIYQMPADWSHGGGAVGVAFYDNYPARIELNRYAGVWVWDSTVCHEHGHIDGQEDLYRHPLSCDSARRFTKMSCGTYIGVTVEPYDQWVVWNVYVPDLPSEVGMYCEDPTWCWVQYNSIRASAVNCPPSALVQHFHPSWTEQDNYCGHYSIYLDNATQVALFFRPPGGDWIFAFNMPPPPIRSWWGHGILKSDWCGRGYEFAVRPTSSLPITWHPMHGGVQFLSGDLRYAGTC